jgi:hypothetical protein
VLVIALAILARPRATASFSQKPPSRRRYGRAALALEDISPDALVSERESGASCGTVEERASVLLTNGAKPSDLQRHPIVAHPGHRTANDDNADQFASQQCAYAKLVADRWRVVAVMLSHERRRFRKVQRG